MMISEQRLPHYGLKECVSDYGSQNANADPEVGPATLRVPWVPEVIIVDCFTSLLRSPAAPAMMPSAALTAVHSQVTDLLRAIHARTLLLLA